MRTRIAAGLVALLLSLAPAAAKDWWGAKLPAPKHFIFGYGSLINTASRDSTSGTKLPAIPVRVSAAFGYLRTWNDRSPSGFTALGLRKPAPGEAARTINGVLYPVGDDDIARFDQREAGYARVEVPREDIEAVSWQGLPDSGQIWVYVPVQPGGEPGVGLPAPDAAFPMLESYIDVVLEGGLEYGENFAREVIETTADWSDYWLNDRELARRPWVHDAQAEAVDRLLTGTPDASAKLRSRLFAEPFAIRWASEKGQ